MTRPHFLRFPFGRLLLAISLGTAGVTTSQAQTTWYQNKAQGTSQNWHTLADWSTTAAGTGAKPASIQSTDTFDTNHFNLRSPAVLGSSIFGGGSLRINNSLLLLKSPIATIPTLQIAATGGGIHNSEGTGSTKALSLNVGQFTTDGPVYVVADVSAGRRLALAIDTLSGPADFIVGRTLADAIVASALTLSVADASAFAGDFILETGSNLVFGNDLACNASLVVKVGASLGLNAHLTFRQLTLGHNGLPAGTYSYTSLRDVYPAYFLSGGSGSITTLADAPSTKPEVWRSALYPASWTPGYTDSAGHFLHNFSYAGYRRGELPIPAPTTTPLDVTKTPYFADPTGTTDATAAIQQAIDDAGLSGGGIIYLPAGTYRVAPPDGANTALSLHHNNVILRGAGPALTRVYNDTPLMRDKSVIAAAPISSTWEPETGSAPYSLLSADTPGPTRELPVDDASLFSVGDRVVIYSDPTTRFIAELGMTGKWTPTNMQNQGLAFLREIVAVDPDANHVTIDVPTRYRLLTADRARVIRQPHPVVAEIGVENLAIGMRAHAGSGLGGRTLAIPAPPPMTCIYPARSIFFTRKTAGLTTSSPTDPMIMPPTSTSCPMGLKSSAPA